MQNLSDAELVDLYKQSKDKQYLTTLFTRHSDVVYRTALRIMKNASDAEDIMQTGYCKMIRDLPSYNGSGTVLGWMIQVIIHTCYQQKNSEKSRLNREKKMMSERPTTSEPKNNELSETVENHLNKLPEIYKVPITLQIMEGLSIKEVSQALEIPEKTIRSQIARGLEKLRASLQTVGITASIISLGDLLKGIQQPLAPEAIKTTQYFQSIFQVKSTVSAKIAASYATKSVISQKFIAISLFFLFSLGGLLYWQPFSKKANPISSFGISQKWDFENTKDLAMYQSIGLLSGAISIEESRGVNNSNALMVSEKTLIEFDISQYKLPIKLSYVTDTYRLTNEKDPIQMVFKSNYLNNGKTNHFFGFRERITFLISMDNPNTQLGYFGKWASHEVYIDENFIDFHVEGKRSHIMYGVSNDNKKIYLYAYKSIIDNIQIESIEKQLVPKEFTISKANYKLSIENGVNVYYLDKEGLGMKDSTANPHFIQRTPESIVTDFGMNNTVILPSLNASNKIVWEKVRNKNSNQWNFENSTDLSEYQNIGLVNGAIAITDSLGENLSKGLVVDAETILEFDISSYQLPIRISYKIDPLMATAAEGQMVLKGNYHLKSNMYYLSGLKEKIVTPTPKDNLNSSLGFMGQWFSQICYVGEDFVDLWTDDKLTHILKGSSTDNKKAYLYIKGQAIIDNFLIESIDKKDLPDHSMYEKIVSEFKLKKDAGNFQIDKEKWGLDKNSDINPSIVEFNPLEVEKSLKTKHQAIYPRIGESKQVEWTNLRQTKSQTWQFETNKLEGIHVVFGKAVVSPTKGVNNSSCLEVDAGTLLEFDVSRFKLPIKFEQTFDCNLPAGKAGEGILCIKGNYEVQKNIFSFSKLTGAHMIDISEGAKKNKNENVKLGYFGEWSTRTIYISDECIDLWMKGKRNGVVCGSSMNNQKIYLLVKDQTIFTNFEIKSIPAAELPDYSAFNKFVEKISFKKIYSSSNIESEKAVLGIDASSAPKLDIYDKFTLEYSLGVRKMQGKNSSENNQAK